jgi:hypothetical protein
MIRKYWAEERWMAVTDDQEMNGYRFVAVNRRITRLGRMNELIARKVPPQVALASVGLPPVEVQELTRFSAEKAQQEAQQLAQQAQEQGQQPQDEQLQSFIQQRSQQIIAQHPWMQEEFTQYDLAQLDVDMQMDVVPDTGTTQQTQFTKMSELLGSAGNRLPPDMFIQLFAALIEISQFRDKKKIMGILRPEPDPMAAEMKKLQFATQQAQLEKIRAETQRLLAEANDRNANAEFKMGPQAVKSHAQAAAAAAQAGSMMKPKTEGER